MKNSYKKIIIFVMIIAIFTIYNYIHIKNINEKNALLNKIEI